MGVGLNLAQKPDSDGFYTESVFRTTLICYINVMAPYAAILASGSPAANAFIQDRQRSRER
jgi:hypothetical protein